MKYLLLTNPIISINNYEMPNESCAPIGCRPPLHTRKRFYDLLCYSAIHRKNHIASSRSVSTLLSFSLLRNYQLEGSTQHQSNPVFTERRGKISAGCTLMLDEMYLQKSSEYHGGSMIGQDDNGYFFNGILASMIVGLKKSIPCVIKAISKTTISDKMVMKKISK